MPQNIQHRSGHTITPFTNIYLFIYLQILPLSPTYVLNPPHKTSLIYINYYGISSTLLNINSTKYISPYIKEN